MTRWICARLPLKGNAESGGRRICRQKSSFVRMVAEMTGQRPRARHYRCPTWLWNVAAGTKTTRGFDRWSMTRRSAFWVPNATWTR